MASRFALYLIAEVIKNRRKYRISIFAQGAKQEKGQWLTASNKFLPGKAMLEIVPTEIFGNIYSHHVFIVSINSTAKSMKNFTLYLVALAMVVVVFGCEMEDVYPDPISNVTAPIDDATFGEFTKLATDFYNAKAAYLIDIDQNKEDEHVNAIGALCATQRLADETVALIKREKVVNELTGLKFNSAEIDLKVETFSSKVSSDTLQAIVSLFESLPTSDLDSATNEQAITVTYHEFAVAVSSGNGQMQLLSETEILGASPSPERIAHCTLSLANNVSMPTIPANGRVTNYSYSGTNAAKFGYDHAFVVTNVPGYYDFSSLGGDCTNYLSWCLKTGGWAQTNNWFFISAGVSGNNMSTCKRSPSWSAADRLNQYITNRLMYQGVNGNNRVEVLFGPLTVPTNGSFSSFLNTVKSLKKGDIVQIGNGTVMHHSMIVTKTTTTSPYVRVSYRNATGYSPARDLALSSISGGSKLYGYRVKSSGY